jgi:hyperosmotically inducible protein
MKTSLKTVVLLTLCAGGLAWLPTGCAQAPTTMKESTGEYIDDSTITADVASQLVEDLSIKDEGVKVATLKGVVTLTGFVETSEQRMRAERIAAGAHGVHQVDNQITLKQ